MQVILVARLVALGAIAVMLSGSRADAQSLSGVLETLVIEQRPAVGAIPDAQAAAATFDSLAQLIRVELDALPVASSAGGFVYYLNPTLGIVERASNGFGPFFTESVLRGGREQAGVGVRLQSSKFTSLQGTDLSTGIATNATRASGTSEPFSRDLLQLTLETRSVAFVGSYGVSDRLSVGASIPVVHAKVRGQRVRTVNGVSSIQSTSSGVATGLGDVSLNGRYRMIDRGGRRLSAGADLRVPTGAPSDFLGAGKLAGRMLALGSWEGQQLGVHVNTGVGLGGLGREVFYATAGTYAVTPRVTLVGELVGRRLSELNQLRQVYEPTTGVDGFETMHWQLGARGRLATFVSTGAKWNIARSWLVNGNVLFRVGDSGLRARVTPTISLEFDFQQ